MTVLAGIRLRWIYCISITKKNRNNTGLLKKRKNLISEKYNLVDHKMFSKMINTSCEGIPYAHILILGIHGAYYITGEVHLNFHCVCDRFGMHIVVVPPSVLSTYWVYCGNP